jgi:hypothetical protein
VTRVSLPGEHGAYLTLAGGALAAAMVAPAPLPALGAAVAMVMAFLARGPIERRARGAAPREWDAAALVAMVGLAVAGALIAGVPALLLAAAAVPVAAFAARRSRRMRTEAFEIAAMGALGASAGLAAWCGGLAVGAAAAVGVVLGVHAATSVAVVRGAVRGRGGLLWAAVAVGAAAVAVVAVGQALCAVALLPRIATMLMPAEKVPARRVGLREAGALAVVVLLLATSASA